MTLGSLMGYQKEKQVDTECKSADQRYRGLQGQKMRMRMMSKDAEDGKVEKMA